jgi:predicted amino acid racemase
MGLYHSVGIAYGFELPADTDLDAIDRALFGQPNTPDSVGHLIIGDRDQLLLVTEVQQVKENTVVPLTGEYYTRPEVTQWLIALHEAAVRIGYPDHPMPTWLVIHNYR